MTRIIAPSILSANFENLEESSKLINSSEAVWLHVDVMDGDIDTNMYFGVQIVAVLKEHCSKPLDVHLMIIEPDKHIERFVEAGADILTVHYETLKNPNHTLQAIRKHGVKVGISINPDIPVNCLRGLVKQVDIVLLMSVFAGFGGQKFIEDTWCRIDELKEIISAENENCLIEIDGGVNEQNASNLFNHGANILVAASAVFNSTDPKAIIHNMLQ